MPSSPSRRIPGRRLHHAAMSACPAAAVPGGAAGRRDAVSRRVPWTFRLTAPCRSDRRPRMPRPGSVRRRGHGLAAAIRSRVAVDARNGLAANGHGLAAAIRSRVAVDARSGLAANGHGLRPPSGRALLSMPVMASRPTGTALRPPSGRALLSMPVVASRPTGTACGRHPVARCCRCPYWPRGQRARPTAAIRSRVAATARDTSGPV